ncbi:MAG: NAD+ synthase [Thermoanaerobaculia bacterium]
MRACPAVDLGLRAELAVEVLGRFIADAVETTATEGVVVGLSGGVDSALAAALAARALGPERVHAFYLPYTTSSEDAARDAVAVAASLDLPLRRIDISPIVNAYLDAEEPQADRVRRGNFMARVRMAVLFDQAKRLGALVLGTSNKTEILLGYSTLFGDNASSLNPLGDLYKRQVLQLSRHLGLPGTVIDKPSSADLWPGQTDEDELGFPYAVADEVLYLLFDQDLEPEEVIDRGYDPATVDRIVSLEAANRYKRRLMLICRLSSSAINLDREIPRD